MAGTLRDKTLNYRRAEWVDAGGAPNLERCIRQALAKLKTVEDRTIIRDGRAGKVARDKVETSGLFLHIAFETPGEAASVIPKAEPDAVALDLRTEDPPDDGEWLDGDAFVYVNADNVCFCTTGLHENAVSTFIIRFFEKAKSPDNHRNFVFMKAADIKALTLLQKEGVEEIEIKATAYKATTNYVRRRTHAASMIGTIWRELKSLAKRPHDVTNDALRISISIKTDGRSPGNAIAIGEKEIKILSEDLINNFEAGDEYVIHTKTGKKITPNEIFVRATASIEANGKTVDRDKAWQELMLFHNRLKASGVFEQ